MADDRKLKSIRNADSEVITVKATFEPLVREGQHEELQAKLDQRGSTQRGKPRSKDPNKNPFGARLFDMDCRWPMYRVPYRDSFRYHAEPTCSLMEECATTTRLKV